MVSPSELEHLSYEEHGDVGVWIIEDFGAYFESGEMEGGEAHYREVASEDRMDGTVVVMENAADLGSDVRDSLDHINEEWSKLGDAVGIDRVGYVADGIMASAVEANLEADVETDSFDSIDGAVEWARG
jgi:hypothetical protein